MFEHGLLPLIHDHSLRHPPPPPDNDRVSDHNAEKFNFLMYADDTTLYFNVENFTMSVN